MISVFSPVLQCWSTVFSTGEPLKSTWNCFQHCRKKLAVLQNEYFIFQPPWPPFRPYGIHCFICNFFFEPQKNSTKSCVSLIFCQKFWHCFAKKLRCNYFCKYLLKIVELFGIRNVVHICICYADIFFHKKKKHFKCSNIEWIEKAESSRIHFRVNHQSTSIQPDFTDRWRHVISTCSY